MQNERVMARTIIPNGILLLCLLYLGVLVPAVQQAEKMGGVIFLAVVFALILLYVWHYRNKYDCLLKVTDSSFGIRYLNPLIPNRAFAIAHINSSITIKRYIYGSFRGGFPRPVDYLNVRWYFLPEMYELSFVYGEEPVTVTIQPNLIGFEKALNTLIAQANIRLEQNEDTETFSSSVARSLILLVVADAD